MRILTINTNNSAGGATKACVRLHHSLIDAGLEADLMMLERPASNISKGHSFYEFYLQDKNLKQNGTFFSKLTDKLQYHLGVSEEAKFDNRRKYEQKLLSQKAKHLEVFTFSGSIYKIKNHPLYQSADIIHLHWISNNFIDYKSFFIDQEKPVVWTLHDMNPFTGGCHYSEECKGYLSSCANCPQLKETEDPDYANKELKNKVEGLLNSPNLTIVSPSRWLMNLSMQSTLLKCFDHHLIPYGIDSDNFKPRESSYSRKMLGIPDDKPVILFVAHGIHSKRKGYEYLLKALERLNLNDKVSLCAVGAKMDKTKENLKGVYELGVFTDERMMSIAYSAADVFVIPSLEDNLPNTVLESLLCGTPVIGFPTGGIPDMVQDGKNGYLCSDVTVDSLVEKLQLFLDNPEALDRNLIRNEAVKCYDSKLQADRYIRLYKQLLE